MATSRPSNRKTLSCWLLAVLVLGTPHGQAGTTPLLRYESPGGFGSSMGDHAQAWVSDGLDGVIHVYAFQRFEGDFQKEFRRALFRDRIAVPYRDDRLLAAPVFKALTVKGADASIAASFRNFNGGAPREHLRVAILAAGFVALVDFSANSPEAFERHWPSVSRSLRSLHVVERGLTDPRGPERAPVRPTPRSGP